MLSPQSIPRLNEEFSWEPLDDGCIIYSTQTTQVITLNALAELTLSYCDGESPLHAIYQSVNTESPLPESDFENLINQLVEQKILLLDS